MDHRSRGGTRGGQAQFSWEDVKTDAQRDHYLGASLLAPVGRWTKNRDITWYARDSKDGDNQESSKQIELRLERERCKNAEADAMAEALGFKVGRRENEQATVSQKELQGALQREQFGDGERDVIDEVVHGVGYGRMNSDSRIMANPSIGTLMSTSGKDGEENKRQGEQEESRRKSVNSMTAVVIDPLATNSRHAKRTHTSRSPHRRSREYRRERRPTKKNTSRSRSVDRRDIIRRHRPRSTSSDRYKRHRRPRSISRSPDRDHHHRSTRHRRGRYNSRSPLPEKGKKRDGERTVEPSSHSSRR